MKTPLEVYAREMAELLESTTAKFRECVPPARTFDDFEKQPFTADGSEAQNLIRNFRRDYPA